MIPTKEDCPKGLHLKYTIGRVDGKTIPDSAEFFILRLDDSKNKDHLLACRLAILTYADAMAATKPELALDLYARYNRHPKDNTMLKPEPHI